MSLAQRMHFLLDMFQMTTIVFVSVINNYHIIGLHLFWDILYLLRQKQTYSLLGIHIFIPVSFPLVKAPLKLFFWFCVKLCCWISFSILQILKSDLSDEFLI